MKEQFVTYEIALKLKKLGFDEKCFALFDAYNENNLVYLSDGKNKMGNIMLNSSMDYSCTAPLWQQAVDWLFQKLDFYYTYLELQIFADGSGCWHQSYDELTNNEEVESMFDNKEEMVLEGIKLLEKCKK